MWDLQLGLRLKTFKRNDAEITSLAFAEGERFAAASRDWSVVLWEASTPSAPLHVFGGHGRDVLAVAYSPTSQQFASGSADKTVKLWSGQTLAHVRTYPRGRSFVTALSFSPDGELLLSGTVDGTISVYSAENRKRLRRYRVHSDEIRALAFLGGSGEFVSASADGTVRLWDADSRRGPEQTYGSEGAQISHAASSPDGRHVAVATQNGTIQIWNGAVAR